MDNAPELIVYSGDECVVSINRYVKDLTNSIAHDGHFLDS